MKPRICLLTTESFLRHAWRCGFYEAQDVLAEIDDVDILYLQPRMFYESREALQRRVIWHDFTGRAVSLNIAYKPIRLERKYDLFVAYIPYYRDLIHLSAISGLREQCGTSICWIDELWATKVPQMRPWLAALNQFDHIAIGLEGTVAALATAIKRQCHWVSGGIDAFRFAPISQGSSRVIDIYSIGPAWEGMHLNLLNYARSKGLFYVFDTFHASNTFVKDHRQHRELFANMAKRSKYFLVAPAKFYNPNEIMGQLEAGFRYFEASAAGTILVGQAPKSEAFGRLFNWADAVIEVNPDGSDIKEVLAMLEDSPGRQRVIRSRNRREALLRHDWVYRWEQIYNIVGIEPREKFFARKERLRIAADALEEG